MTASPVPTYAEFSRTVLGDDAEPAADVPFGALPPGDYALLARLDDAVRRPSAAAEADLVAQWHSLTLEQVYRLTHPDD
ncbi:hypothetical protein [Actinokineospora bangkokensis]|uniref:Uncharacterized protein n=1 Tax=Actinokineospora bangkokensis TaxID=1193682 RepID=A0A1Q9LRL5_9PSEU|nr:hypothetical protein [Actinokineospora bangkokensis]OLR94653.1 hypothetical protein BJP25_13100 [Actinokineospora bangkokensis]